MLRSPLARRSDGFTLLELMIVVTIIAVMAAAAGPTIAAGVQAEKSARASSDMVRLMTRARSASQAYGRAYLARYSAANDGSIKIYRGTNNRCNATDWAAVTAVACASNPLCIDDVDMRRYASAGQTVVMFTAAGHNDICFEPSGRTFYRTGTVATDLFTDRNTVSGGFRFTFTRKVGGVATGVVRRVVVPLGGDARVLR
ncbi:MAG: prepilin-type N-terminal cleavage/methylation domain-containing protein [Myxococcales bacterium]|nr:prepilin-type N-terminal cleavage/methylation domain-containing protein [Myxococcales bacterium]